MEPRTRYEVETNAARRFRQVVCIAIEGQDAVRDVSAQAPHDVDYRIGDLLPIVSEGDETLYRIRKTDRREEIEDEGTLSRTWIVYVASV